ncbi:MAG: hypothetical protein UR98_C0014G0007 [Parcubacteria group bacterium GW2011_GWA1_36_12]|uniref:Peptidase E n=1 Tax=Candidatus Daviesbacteria bacterium GW2011_GWB1_41_5 TaxID=1618429 RepID=A0A0G0WM50_9BACT|nr:MAG: hypothetical protein UR98_C0014G0007 [Parcubacteria group bacterium GW2011_GWA1_36_12]KKS13870.1 MAG: hypothetical protein UU67_C0014G0004 [Candidatus Daviesbacteria bacterium GW2011_GWB1_41_5]
MSYNIYLSGGGSSQDTYQLDDIFLNSIGKRLLYIPVGLKRSFAGYDDCVKWFTDMVSSHNISKEVSVWINLKDKAKELKISNFDAVYMGGASDTLRLHNMLHKFNFYPQLRSFSKDGGIIYGGSGGASVMGRTINYDQLDKRQLTVTETAADLCGGYSIFTHLNDKNQEIIERLEEGNVIAIPEGGGCLLDGEGKNVLYKGVSPAIMATSLSKINLGNNQVYSMIR